MIICSLIHRFCITVLDALETTPFVDQKDSILKRSVEKISKDHLSSTEEQGISRAKVSIKFKFQRFVFHHVSIHFR